MARRRTRQEWQKLVQAWRRSGLTARAFASKHALKVGTLHWWSSQLNKPKAEHETDVGLVRVDLPRVAATVEVAIDGVSLRFQDAPACYIAEVVAALRDRC